MCLIINIGIVDDHVIVRTALDQFFSEQVDLRIVGEAANGREAIDLVRTTLELDVLLLDLSMPGQDGIDALAMIRAKAPDLGILILSGYPEAHLIPAQLAPSQCPDVSNRTLGPALRPPRTTVPLMRSGVSATNSA